MRGNRYALGADPMKSRARRKREKEGKMKRAPRAQRLHRRLRRIDGHKSKLQKDGHMSALMESYALRRQKERRAAAAAKAAPPRDDGLAFRDGSKRIRGEPKLSAVSARPKKQ